MEKVGRKAIAAKEEPTTPGNWRQDLARIYIGMDHKSLLGIDEGRKRERISDGRYISQEVVAKETKNIVRLEQTWTKLEGRPRFGTHHSYPGGLMDRKR